MEQISNVSLKISILSLVFDNLKLGFLLKALTLFCTPAFDVTLHAFSMAFLMPPKPIWHWLFILSVNYAELSEPSRNF